MNTEQLQQLLKIQDEIIDQQEQIIELLKNRSEYLETKIKEERQRVLDMLDRLQSTFIGRK